MINYPLVRLYFLVILCYDYEEGKNEKELILHILYGILYIYYINTIICYNEFDHDITFNDEIMLLLKLQNTSYELIVLKIIKNFI